MSLKDQIALGKNAILQKKCDKTCFNFKRAFRHSRRKLDALEEDCVSSLYHLLLDAKERQETQDRWVMEENQPPNIHGRRVKSAAQGSRLSRAPPSENAENIAKQTRRPATSMSLRNYHVSYSFVKDGMDISKIYRDKVHHNANFNKVSFTRSELPQSSGATDINVIDSAADIAAERTYLKPTISKDYLNRTGVLNRPQVTNTLIGRESRDMHSPVIEMGDLRADNYDWNYSETTADTGDMNKRCHLQVRPATVLGHSTASKSLIEEPHTTLTHPRFKTTAGFDIDSKNDITGKSTLLSGSRLKTTENSSKDTEEEPSSKNSGLRPPFCRQTKNILQVRSSTSRLNTRAKSREVKDTDKQHQTDNILHKSAEKTQKFLREYAKKSKVFSYVVNANMSVISHEEKKIHRSPRVTYQELVTIKASVKKQLLQTRVLLQKSARLSGYVDKLAGLGTKRAQRGEQIFIDMKDFPA